MKRGWSVKRHLLYYAPENNCIPRIPNIINTKSKNITTFPRSGKASIRALTSILILGIAFILLKGLNTLKVRIDLKFDED